MAIATRSILQSNWKGPVSLIATIILLVVVFSLINSRFASLGNFQNVLDQASVPLIIAVGATMVILLGSIDLSVEGVMGAAGMTWILLSANSRGGPDFGIWAWVIALLLALALGLVAGVIYTKIKVPSFVVTLGMWYVGLGVASIMYGNGLLPRLTDAALAKWPTRLTFGLPNSFWLALAVVVIGVLVIRFTRLGRVTLAIGNNESIARTSGLPVARTKILVFALAGLLSGLAGILATMELGSGAPGNGSGALFTVIPAVVIGGTSLGGGEGGVLRSILGVFLLIILDNGLVISGVNPSYQSAVSGAILVLAIVMAAWPQRDYLKVAK